MTDENCRILGFGSPIVDLLAHVSDEFLAAHVDGEKGGMVLVDAPTQKKIVSLIGEKVVCAAGGSAFNTISALTSLGISTSFCGKLGQDSYGKFFMDFYRNLGGELSRFRLTDEFPTSTCLSMVTPDSERTMRTFFGASAQLKPEELADADFQGITHFHVEGYMLFAHDVLMRALSLAREHHCTVSFDLSSFEVVKIFRGELDELLSKYVDIVFANEDEAVQFLNGEIFTPELAAERLLKLCPTACVKLGKKGAYLKERGGETSVIAPRIVKAVDTTGAGDLWQAGFLYGYLQGWGLEKAGMTGSLLGSEIVQVLGGMIPAERWNAVKEEIQIIKEK